MNRSIAMRLLLSVSTLASVAQAQVSSNQTPQNIVTVSFNAAVLQTAEAKRELGALQSRLAPRQAQLQTLSNEVEGLRKQLTDAGDKLTDTDRETRERSLEEKEKQLQRQAEDFRNDTQGESQHVFQKVAQKVYAFLQAYSQQHGYSAVIERGSDAAPVVWYATGNLDITDQLAKAYDAQASANGSSGGSAATPAKTLPDSPAPH
jgi:outer membrane protein